VQARRRDRLFWLVLAGVSYVPLLLTKPGLVAADTKQYLYLDPGRLTTGAASMWDPNTGLGTVTHQNIGYLFPMGPYYTLVRWLGIPLWVGQRLWMGSLLMAAGLGVAYCARRLGLESPGREVAAFAYTLSPYLIDYLARTSAIVMPWAALGWMIGLTAMAARRGGWRYPAAFAVLVALVGGVNATSILLVLVGPALWLVYGVWGTREISGRAAGRAAAKIGALSILVSLWWAAGLWAEGMYGLNVLRVTETIPTVSRTSSAAEVLRGLGYWYFYGWDKVQPWTLASVSYTQSLWLLGVSFAVPVVSVALGLMARWRYRGFAVGLVGIGTAVAVGAYPFARPSLFGDLLERASGGTVGLALRSVNRIVPLVVLGLALLMGAGLNAVRLRWPAAGLVGAAACLALVAVDLPPLWTGNLVASNLARPSSIPAYWEQAAAYLNQAGSSSRVLGLPGEDFAAYSWGVTADPVAPGLLQRPYVARQVVPSGTPAAANLLEALDEPLQEGTLDPQALGPVARLISVGQVLLQSDLQYERYDLPLPQSLWNELVPPPAGLSPPVAFGAPNPAPQIRYPLDSEARLALPAGEPQPPALAVFNVADPRPLVRTESAAAPMIIAGDGRGVVEAAAAGLLGGDPTILYSGSLAQDPTGFARAMADAASLVVTDTNALAGQKWGSLRDNLGQVDQPGVPDLLVNDPSDYVLPLFPGADTASNTIAQVQGVTSVRASIYGDTLTYTPENRPLNAVDGDPTTAWTFGARSPVAGQRLQINLDRAVSADQVTLLQAQLQRPNRRISKVTLRFDGSRPVTVNLSLASFRTPGQTVSFPARKFHQLEVTIDAATGGTGKRYDGLSSVGFADVGIPGVAPATEVLRLPTDLLDRAGPASIGHALTILMARSRVSQPPRSDPERTLARAFTLPTARTFTLGGTAEINAGDSDYLINQLVGVDGLPGNPAGPPVVVHANSLTRLVGDRLARANAAVDGNPATAWVTETGPQAGAWMSVTLDRPIRMDHLDLQIVNDGRHSLPTQITVSTEQGSRQVTVPTFPVGTGRPQGATTSVPVRFPALAGKNVRFTIDAVHQVRALDYYATFAGATDVLPVGLAELGLPVVQPPLPVQLPVHCQSGLLRIDGQPVDVEVTGTTAAALAGDPLTLRGCGNATAGIRLGAGPHVVQTSPRLPSGWSIDSLSLASPAPAAAHPAAAASPGAALADGAASAAAAPGSGSSPVLRVDHQDRTSLTVTVEGNGRPFWLVLGESQSAGWRATLPGGHGLGPSRLVDAYANGWYVPAGLVNGPTVIHLTWVPQRVVWAAIGVSAASLAVATLLAIGPGSGMARRRRARRGLTLAPAGSAPEGVSLASVAGLGGSRPRLPWLVGAALVWAVLAGAVSRPVIGLAAGVAVAAGCLWRPGRLAIRGLAVLSLVGLGLYVLAAQHGHHYLPDINWPADLNRANDLAWVGLTLLGADVVVGLMRARAA
jgi:hypothetical protein